MRLYYFFFMIYGTNNNPIAVRERFICRFARTIFCGNDIYTVSQDNKYKTKNVQIFSLERGFLTLLTERIYD